MYYNVLVIIWKVDRDMRLWNEMAWWWGVWLHG